MVVEQDPAVRSQGMSQHNTPNIKYEVLIFNAKNEKHVPPNDGHDETGEFIHDLHGFNGPLLTRCVHHTHP